MKILRLASLLRAVALASGFVACPALHAEEPALDINVRTTVEPPKGKSLGPHPTFSMLATQVASDEKLVRPVQQETLLGVYRLLQEKLLAQGYVPVPDKTRPEILITIQYGRGQLPNPYTLGLTTADVGASAGTAEGGGKMTGETGRSVVQHGAMDYMRRYEVGYESKMQSANREKLFFTITAWDFASMQKGAKAFHYWTTTILVDDPDHRDLNGLYAQMIAAGAEFFNRRIDKPEIEVSTQVRDGKVEVGVPRVIEAPKEKR